MLTTRWSGRSLSARIGWSRLAAPLNSSPLGGPSVSSWVVARGVIGFWMVTDKHTGTEHVNVEVCDL